MSYRTRSWKQLTHCFKGGIAAFTLLAIAVLQPGTAFARSVPVSLGQAGSFAVLAGSTVTNTGPTVINGDVGVSPGTAITGFPPGTINGTLHSGDAVAQLAQANLTSAYNVLAAETPTVNLTGQDLGGLTLTPGVYRFDNSAQLTGLLTLDALGDPNARFDFQIGSTLTTVSSSSVLVVNSAGGSSSSNVYFQVGSSATLGTNTSFLGNILALTSITFNTGATNADGRALARNGAVTLDTNQISINRGIATAAPEPGTLTLLAMAALPAAGIAVRRQRRA